MEREIPRYQTPKKRALAALKSCSWGPPEVSAHGAALGEGGGTWAVYLPNADETWAAIGQGRSAAKAWEDAWLRIERLGLPHLRQLAGFRDQ